MFQTVNLNLTVSGFQWIVINSNFTEILSLHIWQQIVFNAEEHHK